MTNLIDSDHTVQRQPKNLSLTFESSDLEKAGIRVTRADFSRIMGCSKQAVTEWVKSGRITLGADGRIDPRQAVHSLLATGDPARLRAKFLAPLIQSLTAAHERIAALSNELTDAREEAEFERESASDFLRIHEALPMRIAEEWGELVHMSALSACSSIEQWLNLAAEAGGDPGLSFAEALERADVDEEGAGEAG